jgi:hypothetical protein
VLGQVERAWRRPRFEHLAEHRRCTEHTAPGGSDRRATPQIVRLSPAHVGSARLASGLEAASVVVQRRRLP